MSRHLIDHPTKPSRNRARQFTEIERRTGDRIHPMFLNVFRRAKAGEGSQRLRQYLRLARQ